MTKSNGHICAWGNGLAVPLTKPIAKAARLTKGMLVRLVANPGRIVIEVDTEPTLDAMLAAFNPQRHGGEMMAFDPVRAEAPVRPEESRRDQRRSDG